MGREVRADLAPFFLALVLATAAVCTAFPRKALAQEGDGDLDRRLSRYGLSVRAGAAYTFQGVAGGGVNGPLFDVASDENDIGNTVSGELVLELDTSAAGLWQGGFFNFRLDARAGRSILQRAGSVSAVDNDALFPNVVDEFDDEALAVTDLSYTQYLGKRVGFFGGLLDSAEGDENAIAGSALSNAHFLNSALLYSLVEDATVPNASLGGGVLLDWSETLYGSFSVFGTEETAGEDPFDHTEGTTFSMEWTLHHSFGELGGAQTIGMLYGIDASRLAIATDPRQLLAIVLAGLPIPDTDDDTWAFYYNGHQYVRGDESDGWGVFARFGVSDGDPNPVEWTAAAGVGGTAPFTRRGDDRWGIGVFYVGVSDKGLLEGLGVDDEIGGEVFYNLAVTPWLRITPDVQIIDGAFPRSDTTWVLGVRTHIAYASASPAGE